MKKLYLLIGALVVITLIGLGSASYFGVQYQKAQKEIQTIKSDPNLLQKAAQDESKKLIFQVGKLMDLPTGEEPTVATITDISKLKDQPFFTNAKNGNKVIIYTNAKKAILYDPLSNKIIDVAPVNIGSASSQQASQARIVIRNSTSTVGLTSKIESDIKKAFPQANIINKDNSTASYDKSVVIVLSDSAKDAAANLSKSIGINLGELPNGETKPNADILILLGKDKAS